MDTPLTQRIIEDIDKMVNSEHYSQLQQDLLEITQGVIQILCLGPHDLYVKNLNENPPIPILGETPLAQYSQGKPYFGFSYHHSGFHISCAIELFDTKESQRYTVIVTIFAKFVEGKANINKIEVYVTETGHRGDVKILEDDSIAVSGRELGMKEIVPV